VAASKNIPGVTIRCIVPGLTAVIVNVEVVAPFAVKLAGLKAHPANAGETVQVI
jgi:hypothetical protein